MNDMSASFCV